MNAAQITHIFWKEYRTQRSIWLGVLLLIVSIELLVGFSLRDGRGSLFLFVFSLGTILSICYALASISVMFAGEHEENTFEWLRNLPVAWSSLFGGKLLWLAFSWTAAVLVIALVAWLPDIGVQTSETPRQTSYDRSQALIDGFTITGSLLLWGFLFSLTFKRVYAVLIVSVIAIFVGAWPVYFNELGWFIALSGLALVATVVQGSRWLYPKPFLENLSFRLPERSYSLDLALAAPAERSPMSRAIRRHVWLEWQNARWPALSLAIAPIVLMLIFERELAFYWNSVLVLGLAPLACGLGTCRAEQLQERYRFRTNLGVSPGLLWGIKHLVWGGIYLSLLVIYCAAIYVWLTATRHGNEELQFMMEGEPISPQVHRYLESLWPITWLALSFTFCLYAIGHFFSLLNKRAIAAGLYSFVCACGFVFLTRITLLLDVSLLVALVFPAGLMMMFSYARTSDWLVDRNEPQDKRRLAGALVLLGLMSVTSWAVWRIAELNDASVFSQLNATVSALVPAFAYPLFYMQWEPGFGIAAVVFAAVVMAGIIWRCKAWREVAVGYGLLHVLIGVTLVTHFTVTARRNSEAMVHPAEPWPAPDNAAVITGELYRSVQQDVVGKMNVRNDWGSLHDAAGLFTGEEDVSEETWAWLEQNEAVVQRLLEISGRENCAPPDPYQPWSRQELDDSQSLPAGIETIFMLRLNALRAERKGRLDDAWISHLANVRMFRHMLQWQRPVARSALSVAFTEPSGIQFDLHRWIDHPDQRPELLAKAAEDLDVVFNDLYMLDDAYLLQARSQTKAILEREIDNRDQFSGETDHWDQFSNRGLLLLLNRLPWERQRAVSLTGVINANLAGTATDIYEGYDSYGDEIAGSLTGEAREHDHYRVVPLWGRKPSYYQVRLIEERWRLAESTPLLMASYQHPIEGYGVGPMPPAPELIEEVNLIRQRRLLSLHLAIRISELFREVPIQGNWIEQMNQVRWDTLAESVLEDAEEREGKHPTRQAENVIRLRRYLLYYDPVTGELFDQSTIDNWGR